MRFTTRYINSSLIFFQVAVISFSTDIGTPDPSHHKCYEDTLAFASKANIDKLKEYVVSIIETNNADSNFENALLKAFSYLGSSNWTTDVSSRGIYSY